MKTITVSDLKDQTGVPYPPHPILFCDDCESEVSANRGDYFAHNLDHVLMCDECNVPMRLVYKRTVYEDVVLG